MNTVCILEQPLELKEWQGQRVITFKDVDRVHQRPSGTASRNFKSNRKHFIANVDYFLVKREDVDGNSSTKAFSSIDEFRPLEIPPKGLTLLTESGYLMLAKSLTDDLAWDVQRALVNNYFRGRQPVQQQLPMETSMPARKTWNGVPVMTTRDVAQVMQCSRDDVQYWASQCGVCGMILSGEYLRAFKRENNSHSSAWKVRILSYYDVEVILRKAGRDDCRSLLDEYFMPDHALDHEDMRFAVRQADLLFSIAREIKDPVVKEMNLKAVTALLIDIGLWNEKHAGFNGVTSNLDINSLEGWNKDRALNEAKRYWKM
jgi:hypothetical protein